MSQERKDGHIDLAMSLVSPELSNFGLHYEPLFSSHPPDLASLRTHFLTFDFKAPIWISSMTGGAQKAQAINKNLAQACEKFGLGMGLGSVRCLLNSNERLSDFDIKKYMPSRPLFLNLGLAQLEELILQNKLERINQLAKKLSSDGLIIHVNPLQEWAQKEGDRFQKPAIESLKILRDFWPNKLVVKEVGHGMGPRSLMGLLDIGVDAIEFGAYGGTNFTQIEQKRSGEEILSPFQQVGHDAAQMIVWLNQMPKLKTAEYIISGGIKNAVHGHALRILLKQNSLIGLASGVLKPALLGEEALERYLLRFIDELNMANSFLVQGENECRK